MTALAAIVGGLIGILGAECLARSLRGGSWLWRRVAQVGSALAAFRRAVVDDERQAHLVRAGKAAVGLGGMALGAMAAFAMLVASSPFVLGWDEALWTWYLLAMSGAAIAWWLTRPHALRLIS